jgi:hypothetical protein
MPLRRSPVPERLKKCHRTSGRVFSLLLSVPNELNRSILPEMLVAVLI